MANLTDAKLKPVSLKMVKQAIQAIKNAEPVLATDEEANEMIDKVFGKVQRYYIRKHGENVDYVTMQQFVDGVKKGTIAYEEGKQIVIPYTNPVNGITYDLPFNFGTTQQFQKEDGSTFTGLGLVAEYAVPTYDIQFDNAEPSNSDSQRKSRGNNRWMYSNLRQWLNKSGRNWYTAQHSVDAAPDTPDPVYDDGFLSYLPADFVEAIIPVKQSTKTHSVDGGGYDTTYDKFFPLSMSQVNIKCTDTSYGLNDESEGRYWEYWRNKSNSSDYLRVSSNFNSHLIIYSIENHATACYWWWRSAHLIDSSGIWHAYAGGLITSIYANSTNLRVSPACVIG